MIFYNYFENITDKFKLIIKNKTQSYTINFKNGSYNVSDISKIIDDEIKNNFNNVSEKEKYVQIVIDVNRYAILIVIKENWVLELDKNFMDLFGFEKNIFEEGYHRSTLTPNLDKTKFLKIYCNLVDNKEDNEFLTNVFMKNKISDQIIYENDNIYKRKRILNTSFNYIEVCVFSNKKISEFYCISRKLNCSCIFIAHRYFKNVDRTLKNNIDYLIFTQLDKKELNMLYQDINLDISLKEFQDINTNLKKYEFILIDKYNEYKFMKIRKNLNQIYICK